MCVIYKRGIKNNMADGLIFSNVLFRDYILPFLLVFVILSIIALFVYRLVKFGDEENYILNSISF